jgi:hypothetical protein
MRQFVRGQRSAVALTTVAQRQIDEAAIRDRINRSMRRRMSDELVSLIRRACLCGHAETAKGLWVVLRDLTMREAKSQYPNGRIPEKGLMEALALEISAASQDKTSMS